MMANVPAELRYTKEHEWAKLDGDKARVGITAFAQEQLGDVVFVELPKVGAKVSAMKTFGVVESVKAVSDLFAPLSGEVAEINVELPKKPELVNTDPYDNSVPSPINHLIARGEFLTAYTPYQPQASQGTLRSIFEYQSMMAELTGMDVANASLYDGASSVAEAALMAHAVTERNAVVLSKGVNPLYRQVVETYCEGPGIRLKSAPIGDGTTDLDALRKAVTGQTAAVVIQYPNFFGCLEDIRTAADIAHGEI